MRFAFALPALLLALAALQVTAADQPSAESPDWFPFNISALEGSPTAIDLSWLNEMQAMVLGVKAKVSLPGDAAWKVEALDPMGAPKAVVAEKAHEFEIHPAQKTVWWLLTR